ncbi:hypothetical protein A3E49_02955 [Candidatus Saccharibacteria bacterium RIFCSPHIGHO2_12_FULL_49_19]|nr:MAG: hypothetical protein A2708_00470 [Candidatus Saccharibacteria bacterium RIFCSPHIGHO2_01_FULL_49_21]OGL36336.1 MAG: hypothetical protein A3E49_02955 [Candidatus Saccharibacteria bacterium RIFCSPHIGHO2_12_FULL_49_19]
MVMSGESRVRPAVLSPAYWDGVDIFDIPLGSTDYMPEIRSDDKKYLKSVQALEDAAKDIYAGSYTEVKYPRGVPFGPPEEQMGDGSVVITDNETIVKFLEEVLPGQPIFSPITAPFVEYWRQNLGNPDIGWEMQSFGDEFPFNRVLYARELRWGVLSGDGDGERYIQQFIFNSLKRYGEDFLVTNNTYAHRGLRLPLEIGEAYTLDDNESNPTAVGVSRVLGVDVVYPAFGSKQPKKKRRLFAGLGKLSLHRPAPNFQT